MPRPERELAPPKRIKLKLKDAGYRENFQVGAFLFRTYELSAYIQEGQTRAEVMRELRLQVNEQFLEDNPHLANHPVFECQPPEPQILPSTKIEKTEPGIKVEDIMSCMEMTVLESYRLLVNKNDELKAAYDLRREQLKQIEIKSILTKTEAQCQPVK